MKNSRWNNFISTLININHLKWEKVVYTTHTPSLVQSSMRQRVQKKKKKWEWEPKKYNWFEWNHTQMKPAYHSILSSKRHSLSLTLLLFLLLIDYTTATAVIRLLLSFIWFLPTICVTDYINFRYDFVFKAWIFFFFWLPYIGIAQFSDWHLNWWKQQKGNRKHANRMILWILNNLFSQ